MRTNNDMTEVLRTVLNKYSREQLNDTIPAQIISYNGSTNKAVVKPLLAMSTGKDRVDRPNLFDIPVLRNGGGGFLISFPIKTGDYGWLKATDRDISNVLLNQDNTQLPPTNRHHSFEDAVFIPDQGLKNIPTGSGISIQNESGTSRIDVKDDQVGLSSTDVNVAATNDLSLSGANGFNISSPGSGDGSGTSLSSSPSGGLSLFGDSLNISAGSGGLSFSGPGAPSIITPADAVNVIYPVGSIYISTVATNPAILFGVGTWVAIGGQFLLGTNGSYGLGSTGGSKDAVVVSHTHGVNINSGIQSADHIHYGTTDSANANHIHYTTVVTGISGGVAGISSTAYTGSGTATGQYMPTGGISSTHQHGFATGGVSANHYHNVNGNTNSSGVAGTDKNMPPYIAVSIWKRTA